jgi:hypothetical protein
MIKHIIHAFNRAGSKNSPIQVDGDSYMCSMHPAVKSTSSGKCPECGMFLKPADTNAVGKTIKEGDNDEESAHKHGCC